MVSYTLPSALIPELQTPQGKLYPGTTPQPDLTREAPLIAVGDVTAANLLAQGYTPDVAVVDAKTKRHHDLGEGISSPEGALQLKAINPAGALTQELWSQIHFGLNHPGPVWLEVSGEEDLATIAAVALAPEGAQVAYGQPDEGMCVITVDERERAKAYQLVAKMEEN